MQLKNGKNALGRVENSGGKGENPGNQHFRLFPQCFPQFSQAATLSGSLKVRIVWSEFSTGPYGASAALRLQKNMVSATTPLIYRYALI